MPPNARWQLVNLQRRLAGAISTARSAGMCAVRDSPTARIVVARADAVRQTVVATAVRVLRVKMR